MTYSLLDLLILRAVVLLVRAQGPIGRLNDVIGRHKQNNPAPAPQALRKLAEAVLQARASAGLWDWSKRLGGLQLSSAEHGAEIAVFPAHP